METVVKVFGGVVVTFGGIMLLVTLGTLTGAIAGYIVGLFFSENILGIAGQLGVHNVTMWQLGSFLGFIGGFLKTKVSATVEQKK